VGVLLVYVGLLGLTWWGERQLPTGFIPNQDMGYLLASLQLPDSAANERTMKVMDQFEQIVLSTPGVKNTSAVVGTSFVINSSGSNFGSMFIILEDFDKRRDPELGSEKIAARIRERCEKEIFEGQILIFPPPPIRGVARAGGFKVMIEDRGDFGPQALQTYVDQFVEAGKTEKDLVGMATNFRANVPQLYVDIDRKECMTREIA